MATDGAVDRNVDDATDVTTESATRGRSLVEDGVTA